MSGLPISRADVIAAYDKIKPFVRRTPVLTTPAEDFGLKGADLTFKLEFLQHAGSFKSRGAFTSMVTRAVPDAGVLAASGGNHGAAVAFAAMRTGHPATIFVPNVASPAKLAQIEAYGADLRIVGERYHDALVASQGFETESGALSIHAYDQNETLMGQGTVALEFVEQADVDTLLVATGGGGLVGGMAAYLEGGTKLVAVEPEAAPSLYNALEAGKPIEAPAGGVAADSLAPKMIGEKPFQLAQAFVADAVLVTDDAIIEAQKALWQTLRVVTEPGGAAAFAALLSGRYVPAEGERVGILLCGANTKAVNL